jgi:hypothetical protein
LTATKASVMNELKNMLSEEYSKIMNLFGEPMAQEASPHWTFNYQIQIKKGKELPFSLIYRLSEKELGALREYWDGMFEQGKPTKSDANMGARVIFVPKPNRKLRLCVDYRELNVVTSMDPYHLPLIHELRN